MSQRTASACGRLLILVLLLLVSAPLQAVRAPAHAQTAGHHTVTWDQHSLLIDGRRVLLYSGEFHYWRLPSVQGWEDRLRKMKAAGLNAVSIYFDWAYHSPAPGTYDFSGVRDVNRLLDITDKLGLYVLARVGPYMNGEADAGGLPGWLLSKPLYPRSQSWNGGVAAANYSPLYAKYAREWYDHIVPIVARHQVTDGGSVVMLQIENEYSQSTGSQQYMQELHDAVRADGVTVPIFHNDYWFQGDWRSIVDLYAFDSYPYGFACCHQWWDLHFGGIDTWESQLRSTLKITTPMFVSELQGGAFDPWGGNGYDKVARTLDGDWLSVLDESVLAQGASIMNTYMFAGGTTWGYMSEPGVYTSYDYGAPISETGELRPAYYAAHRIGMFLQTYGPTLAGADAVPAGAVKSSNPKIVVHARTEPSSGDEFVFVRHGDAGNPESAHLTIAAGQNTWTVPQQAGTSLTLPGHGSALLLANTDVGPLHLNYTTSSVLTDTATAQGHYLVLYGPAGTVGEVDFALPPAASVVHDAGVTVSRRSGQLRLDYSYDSSFKTVAITTPGGTVRLLVGDTASASRVWSAGGYLVTGPDLVEDGDTGPTLSTSTVRDTRAYGVAAGSSLTIDDQATAAPDPTMGMIMLGSLSGPTSLSLPVLSTWRSAAEAPEIATGFDDSSWTRADHPSTSNPNVPSTDTLLADDYGFHYGFVWYRGHFTATGGETGIRLLARQSYDVYLNGHYLGGADESLADPPHAYALPRYFAFPAGALLPGGDNVLAVLTESLGHDEGWTAGPLAQSPQGILEAGLIGAPTSVAWRIQGDAGGEGPADPERGIFNASGLFGERNGWYLPEYNDSAWTLTNEGATWQPLTSTSPIAWYRTHFALTLPPGTDAPVALHIDHAPDKAVIWLNGWLVGRYWDARGPQHDFYLPAGVLNNAGDNVLSIAVWSRGGTGGLTTAPSLVSYPALQTHALGAVTPPAPQSDGYWHTSGNRIVDAAGRPVRIAAVNWFGMENRYFVPAGLDKQPLAGIMSRISSLGFNAIRLPFSNALVQSNPVVTAHLAANPDLVGMHALDVMDRIVAAAGAAGLRIILDDGRSSAGTQPEANGLWYTPAYPETTWIADWQTLVTRYLGNPTVVGVDLRNEPHTGPPGPWSIKTYLKQGATWGPYNGVDDLTSDWRLAAERGGDAVLAINPHLLVLVEGIQQYPDATWPGGVESYWWGGVLEPARLYPVELSVPHQLVYSPHEYGPLKWQMPFFGPHMTYASLSKIWDAHWGYLQDPGYAEQTPVVIGEFGTCGNSVTCVTDTAPGSQGLWFKYFVKYLRLHPQIGWSFWALNGTNAAGNPMDHYILRPNWKTVQLPALVSILRDLQAPPPPGN